MTAQQDELIRRLMLGELGPWAGQGFVEGGITILRPDTMQWETITFLPGDAKLTNSVLSPRVSASTTWLDPTDEEAELVDEFLNAGIQGLETGVGLPAGAGGHVMATVVPAQQYATADFVRTDLGMVRLTEGVSNGADGPLSPIRMGERRQEVDKDGNVWLPIVRFGGVDAERSRSR